MKCANHNEGAMFCVLLALYTFRVWVFIYDATRRSSYALHSKNMAYHSCCHKALWMLKHAQCSFLA